MCAAHAAHLLVPQTLPGALVICMLPSWILPCSEDFVLEDPFLVCEGPELALSYMERVSGMLLAILAGNCRWLVGGGKHWLS